ncbi:RING finger protein 151-like isoform X2 [Liolophura sinensis]|uniref:RING finger protein 151-like isoform X2 n=1 Tax=Liolophura sinensis TaxID=3198878 RepID=UPI00315830D7
MSRGKKRNRRSLEAEDSCEERYFLNPESVSCHLYCSICQEVFVDPQRAPCGHSFCKKCITPWLKQSRTCPEDRKPLHHGQLHHDFILENIIGDQMVACPFRRSGSDSPLLELSNNELVSPGKPSLLMRLFRSGQGSRQLLSSMFDKDKDHSSHQMKNLMH